MRRWRGLDLRLEGERGVSDCLRLRFEEDLRFFLEEGEDEDDRRRLRDEVFDFLRARWPRRTAWMRVAEHARLGVLKDLILVPAEPLDLRQALPGLAFRPGERARQCAGRVWHLVREAGIVQEEGYVTVFVFQKKKIG